MTDYVRFRPSYPPALVTMLTEKVGLGPGRTVADIGSGTGILTALLLETGSRVVAVEPDQAMRRAAVEFRRILKPGGSIALIWNTRPPSGTPFLVAYEAFLERWGTDYVAVREKHDVAAALPRIFGDGGMATRTFTNPQVLDYESLEGRLLSSSYIPARDDPRCPPMIEALKALFESCAVDGRVTIEYETTLYFGRVEGA